VQDLQGEVTGMRSLLVHRLRSARTSAAADVDFRPRVLRPLPAKSEVVIDLCILMDCTGSMGAWIDAAKQHLTAIISELNTDLDVKDIRVAFVAYRDYKDTGRKVVKHFVSMKDVRRVVEVIEAQRADGGGDEPEDVISGVEGAMELEWKGDVRLCLFVADACAHGYLPGQGAYKGHDDYPQGLCPDQDVLLPDRLQEFVHGDDFGVDLLFCQMPGGRTSKMEEMIKGVYAKGAGADADGKLGPAGYGVLPMSSGASAFKEAIVSVLSASLLDLIGADTETSGVQTFDGATMSSVVATMTSSLRESTHAAAARVRHAKEEAAVAAEEAAEAAEIKELEAKVAERAKAKEEAATAAAATAEEDMAEEDMAEDGEGKAAEEAAAAAAAEAGKEEEDELQAELEAKRAAKVEADAARAEVKAAAFKPRSDAQRLRGELEAAYLHPVRLALGLPVVDELQVEAAKSLLKARVTIKDLESMGYPEAFKDAMRKAGASMVDGA